MVIYAIGSVAAWGALTASEQAYYTGGRFDDLASARAVMGWTMLDDVIMELISDITTTIPQIMYTDCDIYSYVVQSRVNPDGNPNEGYFIYVAHNADGIRHTPNINTNHVGTFKDFKIKRTINTLVPNYLIGSGTNTAGTGNIDILLKNLLIDNNNLGEFGLRANITNTTGDFSFVVKNCKLWGHQVSGINYATYNTSDPTKHPIIENCTINNDLAVSIGISNELALPAAERYPLTVKNTVSHSASLGGADWDVEDSTAPGAGYVNVTYCADSDNSLAYGTNNTNNIVPANEFWSLDDTNDNFLFLKEGAVTADWTREPAGNVNVGDVIKFDPEVILTPGALQLSSGGTIPTEGALDITGKAIPSKKDEYPIGCHVQEYST